MAQSEHDLDQMKQSLNDLRKKYPLLERTTNIGGDQDGSSSITVGELLRVYPELTNLFIFSLFVRENFSPHWKPKWWFNTTRILLKSLFAKNVFVIILTQATTRATMFALSFIFLFGLAFGQILPNYTFTEEPATFQSHNFRKINNITLKYTIGEHSSTKKFGTCNETEVFINDKSYPLEGDFIPSFVVYKDYVRFTFLRYVRADSNELLGASVFGKQSKQQIGILPYPKLIKNGWYHYTVPCTLPSNFMLGLIPNTRIENISIRFNYARKIARKVRLPSKVKSCCRETCKIKELVFLFAIDDGTNTTSVHIIGLRGGAGKDFKKKDVLYFTSFILPVSSNTTLLGTYKIDIV